MAPERTPPGIYVEEGDGGARAISGAATSITAFVGRTLRGPVNRPVHVRSFDEFARAFGPIWNEAPLTYAVHDYFQNGGVDALVVRVVKGPFDESAPGEGGGEAITDAEVVGDAGARTGIHALGQSDIFNLLCIPPLAREMDVANATWAAAAAYCVSRRALLLIDPPASWTTSQNGGIAAAEAGMGALRTAVGAAAARNAAVYFPRLRMPDRLGGSLLEDCAPCGAVAGIIVRIDAQRGVWKAPAEASFSGVQGFSGELTDPQRDRLTVLGLNCLRTLPGGGKVVWSARTLAGAEALASEWKYLPVRRLALFLEESVSRGIQWAVFEPNEEQLWSQIRLTIGAFLQSLFRQGAFQGRSPREAFFVKCDRETTTQDDIDRGVVNVDVGFAPLKPAEFVVLRIQQKAGQVTTGGGTDAEVEPVCQRLEDLALPRAALDALHQIVAHLRHQGPFHHHRGIGALFCGGDRIGKTMAAEALAGVLEQELYRVDLSTVVSRYIGETEKNLGRVFDAAEESGAILLLDEAEALFGDRTGTRDAHDRYANSEIGMLLQRIEAYRGLAILTTNRRADLDAAFLRRFHFVVEFPFREGRQP